MTMWEGYSLIGSNLKKATTMKAPCETNPKETGLRVDNDEKLEGQLPETDF